jgi:hypothetical protein
LPLASEKTAVCTAPLRLSFTPASAPPGPLTAPEIEAEVSEADSVSTDSLVGVVLVQPALANKNDAGTAHEQTTRAARDELSMRLIIASSCFRLIGRVPRSAGRTPTGIAFSYGSLRRATAIFAAKSSYFVVT